MVFPEALHVVALCRLWKSNHLRTTWGATQSNGGKLFIAQPVNEENSMQAVVPFGDDRSFGSHFLFGPLGREPG